MAKSHLTPEQIEEMKDRYSKGESAEALAKDYGVTEMTIRRRIGGNLEGRLEIHLEDRELSYRGNLQWAMNAAGDFQRTRRKPRSCPNNAAYFLYLQALEEPKDFMQKFGQVESKIDADESDREMIRSTKVTLGMIDAFLEGLRHTDEEKAKAKSSS